ncbi:polymorphic toxin type 46 domain-containing protein [Nostoc sp. TCL26-01]|uniref:polymorphic toxin type 46 domain-containing protein n=1 Tax=Nostoc sp. TCL26-01 TaxID=2576904 RepID=UPI0015BC017A|nr:polymorphic toxin type 46 domain-containing protein [Nostoc sp. TCL26-01]QLE59986.1 hypothetical protein FD725_31745 [Nostoc sp. TCL26-01]
MNYSQYLEQHQQLTQELDGASKEFEDLRSRYDSASIEERSNLESELKESMNKVETARSNLYSLESQNPEYKQAREEGQSDTRLDKSWQEHWQNHPDSVVRERFETAYNFYQQAGYNDKEALQEMKGINFNREVSVETIQPDEVLKQYQNPGTNKVGNYFTQDSDKSELGIQGDSISNQERKPEFYVANKEIKALKSTNSDVENWTKNKELNYGGGTQYFVAKEDLDSLTSVFQKNTINSPEIDPPGITTSVSDLPQQMNDIDVQDYKTLMSDWNQEIESGIINTDDNMATLVNNANQNLYQKLTGESYEGSSEDLSHSVAEKVGEHFGIENKNEFEQLNEKYVPQLENQQQQEQSQKISY